MVALVLSPGAHAGVTNGQAVSAAITNAAYMDKNTTTTFTTAIADIQGGIETKNLADSVSTGTAQNVTLVAPITIFTNVSLASIQNITLANRVDASLITIRNLTTGTLTLKNLSGGTSSKQINTGTGADLVLANGSSASMYYDTVNSKWQVISLGGSDVNATNIAAGTLALTSGGTGRGTLTNHGVLVGAGTSAITQLATGSAGQALLSGGASADPVYSTPTYPSGSGSAGQILRSDGTNNVYTTNTFPTTAAAGSILNASSANVLAATVTPTIGVAGTSSGTLSLTGVTSGTVTIGTASAAGTYNFNLPISAGTTGQVLTSQGGGSASMTWGSPAGTPAPTVQIFTSTGTTSGQIFFISSASPVLGDTYNDSNSKTYTVLLGGSSITKVFMSGTFTPPASGTLTRQTGSGPMTLTFSSATPLATYTPTAGTSFIKVIALGGGGGGGGSPSSAAASAAAGGGASGSVSIKYITSVAGSYYYAIGALGAGGTAGANAGTGGGTTWFGTNLINVPGGGGGSAGISSATSEISNTGGSSGGAGSGGDINLDGFQGGYGLTFGVTSGIGGQGANSLFGSGGFQNLASGAGNAGTGYGAGGAGGAQINNGGTKSGGAGTAGILILEEYP